MRLDIFVDTICPWCYIGKRRLERALAIRPQKDLVLRWRAFQLNPGMPREGMERALYLESKFGSARQAARVYEAVRAAGEAEAIPFAFERMPRTPNTLASHRLIRRAEAAGRQEAAVEAVFRAYFVEGLDIGATATLAEIASAIGLGEEDAAPPGNGDALSAGVLADDAMARRQGINGVPCFLFQDRFVLSGAHQPEVLLPIFDVAREAAEAAAGQRSAADAEPRPAP
jgi:predicted DsbA family dithiol-disulfide isomerase